jgi:phosphate acetyltransferase
LRQDWVISLIRVNDLLLVKIEPSDLFETAHPRTFAVLRNVNADGGGTADLRHHPYMTTPRKDVWWRPPSRMHSDWRLEMALTNKSVPSPGKHQRYERLLAAARELPRLRVAVAYPCDKSSLGAAFEASRLGFIEPILVGPVAKLQSLAGELKEDISPLQVVDAGEPVAAAQAAVDLVRAGKADAVMKGSLHTDELMSAIVRRDGGLRTARRISHCFVMDVPGHDTALIITDAAINIAPSLEDKMHIVQNAIDLAQALRVDQVRVAILSAMETVNPKVPSTLEAAALCKMADRGQITGALIDGPLALDNAIDLGAAAIKKIASPVAGKANVLVVPDLEAGNMLAKSLTFLADADAAGIVLGARVPVILTSRADSNITRLASCAVASLVADAQRRKMKMAEV